MNTVVPIVFGTFKLLIVVVSMYLAIKSHYDGEKKEKAQEKEREKNKAAESRDDQ